MQRRGVFVFLTSLVALAAVACGSGSAPAAIPGTMWARPVGAGQVTTRAFPRSSAAPARSRVAPAAPQARVKGDPCKTDRSVVCSSIWAGYEVRGTGFTDVRGTWVQPVAACPWWGLTFTTIWVGIGGDGGYPGDTLAQVGTDVDCVGKDPIDVAWTEMFPAPSEQITGVLHDLVQMGDALSAEIRVTGTTTEQDCTNQRVTFGRRHAWEPVCTAVPITHFRLSISDAGQGLPWDGPWSFSKTADVPDADLGSAEWIVEAPTAAGGGVETMADFGTVPFRAAHATDTAASGPISAFVPRQMFKTALHSDLVEARPGPLTGGGSSFSVSRVPGTPGS